MSALKADLALVRLAGFEVALGLPVALARQLGPKEAALRFASALSAAFEAGRGRELALLGELRLMVDGANFTVRGEEFPLKGGAIPCFVALPEEITTHVYCVVEHHDFRDDQAETARVGEAPGEHDQTSVTAERECTLFRDDSERPLALVSERLAAARGATPQQIAREVRLKHLELQERLPPGVFESHSHLVPFTSAGVEWVFAVVQLQAHGVDGFVLIAVLRDEVSTIGPALLRVRTGRFLQ